MTPGPWGVLHPGCLHLNSGRACPFRQQRDDRQTLLLWQMLDDASLVPQGPPKVKRRVRIPDKPNYSLNLWSIMKNCIGRELSKIPMPVGARQGPWGGCAHAWRGSDDPWEAHAALGSFS